MSKPALFDVDERNLTYQQLLEKGRDEGRSEGRRALLQILRNTVGDDAAREAAAIPTLDELQQHVIRLLASR